MAADIKDVKRANPAPCQHFVVDVEIDGRPARYALTARDESVDADALVGTLLRYYVVNKRQPIETIKLKQLLKDVL